MKFNWERVPFFGALVAQAFFILFCVRAFNSQENLFVRPCFDSCSRLNFSI